MSLISLQWYLLTVAALIAVLSCWIVVAPGTNAPDEGFDIKARLRRFISLFIECSISAGAYWALIFVLALVMATALWLIILLIVWVPSDFIHHYLGSDLFSRTLHKLKPLIYRSGASPGMTAIPMLDYLSLYGAFILGPWFGIWSMLSKYQGATPYHMAQNHKSGRP